MVFIVRISGLLEQNIIRLPIPYELNVLNLNFKRKPRTLFDLYKWALVSEAKCSMKSFDGMNNLWDTFEGG